MIFSRLNRQYQCRAVHRVCNTIGFLRNGVSSSIHPKILGYSLVSQYRFYRENDNENSGLPYLEKEENSSREEHKQAVIKIETNRTPNPECLRFFTMDASFLEPGYSLDMPNSGHAYKSPLGKMLFDLDGVAGVFIADEYITITKTIGTSWNELIPSASSAIIEFLRSNRHILSEESYNQLELSNEDTKPHPDDTEPVLAIKELLSSRIRPMLQSDGGNIRFVGTEHKDGGIVYVQLEGACKSCPSSSVTLKDGIERMLIYWVPEVTEVEEVDEEFALNFRNENQK